MVKLYQQGGLWCQARGESNRILDKLRFAHSQVIETPMRADNQAETSA